MRLGRAFAAGFLFSAICLFPKNAPGQATITESNTNFVYVDGINGKDTNAGTQTAPLRTIQAGLNKADTLYNHKNLGSRVEVLPGVYRESDYIGVSTGRTSAPITLEAVTPGSVTIAGSDVYTGWTDEGTGMIFDHPWTYDFGACALPSGWPTGLQPIVSRREMVVVNGTSLTQVLDPSLLIPGTFLVDEANNLLRVAPPSGVDLNAGTVEVATRPTTLTVSGRTNFALRGVGFEHAANCFNQQSAFVWNSTNVLVDQITATTNNWGGFGVANSSNITVQNSVASYNGGFGMMLSHTTNLLLSNSETDYNNWRGAQGSFYDWGMGGIKFWQIHGGTVQNYSAYNNYAEGLWFDTDNRQITVTNARLAGNLLANLQVELNVGPISMNNSVLCYGGLGVNVNSSSGFSLTNSKLFDNGGPGVVGTIQGNFYIAGPNAGRSFTDWQTGVSYTVTPANITLTGNIIEDWSYATENSFGTYLGSAPWATFLSTFASDQNTWFDPNRATSFLISGGKRQTLAQWQAATGLDTNSVWGQPASSPLQQRNCTPPAPVQSDFAVFTDKQTYTAVNGTVNIAVLQKSFGSGFANGSASIAVSGLPLGSAVTVGSLTTLPAKASVNSTQLVTITPGANAIPGVPMPLTIVATQNGRVHMVPVSIIP